ncbi:Uncharacterised protein [Mycobacteroides abscessus subsp. abscessus]|nr:Uncharacterised protein [Mycobacteroides abscessus subsp. abscessus]
MSSACSFSEVCRARMEKTSTRLVSVTDKSSATLKSSFSAAVIASTALSRAALMSWEPFSARVAASRSTLLWRPTTPMSAVTRSTAASFAVPAQVVPPGDEMFRRCSSKAVSDPVAAVRQVVAASDRCEVLHASISLRVGREAGPAAGLTRSPCR